MAKQQSGRAAAGSRGNSKVAAEGAPTRARAAEPAIAEGGYTTEEMADTEELALVPGSVSGFYPERAPGRGELRIDVDGTNPQMLISGLIVSGLADRLHWIAKVTPAAGDQWNGSIWYKNGVAALLPQTSVVLKIDRGASPVQASVTFKGGGVPQVVRSYRRKSAYFHPVEFEFDVVEGTTATTKIKTCAHPNRPAALPCETLSIETAFRRAGFEVSVSPGGGRVPLSVAGANRTWSDTEMHDAMQTYWSRFASKAQWALWVLFAARHDQGPSLGGIMFDSIGPNHRQGTAIFNDSFIADAPAGDPAKAAWVARMRFWTAVHEMGHAFNLAHAWQKALGTPWIPLSNEPEARSYMNYPFRVSGGQTAFFSDFAYRFSDQELLFMRHAPERFVQMGNADWFDNHAFEQAEVSAEPTFRLEVRANRESPVFDFLEPCMLEIKLTNISSDPQVISEKALESSDRMVVIIKKDGKPARQWLPYAQYCHKAARVVLEPGASRYEALFIGAGRNGWDLAEPGLYTVQITLRMGDEDLVSNALPIKVTPPRTFQDEHLAQDLFSEDVGRVLAFDGSRVMRGANDVLRETAAKLPDRPVARHALVALSRPMLRAGKVLDVPTDGPAGMLPAAQTGAGIAMVKAQFKEAVKGMETALVKRPEQAAETLGHIDYKRYADRLSDQMETEGDGREAGRVQDQLYATLEARKVAPAVLSAIRQKRSSLAPEPKGKRSTR